VVSADESRFPPLSADAEAAAPLQIILGSDESMPEAAPAASAAAPAPESGRSQLGPERLFQVMRRDIGKAFKIFVAPLQVSGILFQFQLDALPF
jgi:hypothetical protein